MRKCVIIPALLLVFIIAKDVWSQGAWTQVADFGGGVRSATAVFSIDSKGYVLGGSDGGQFYNDLWEYDPQTNSWTQMSSLPAVKRANAVAFSIGSKAYVGTGYCGGTTYCADFWEWDQATNTWTQITSFPGEGGIGLTSCVAFSIGGRGYVGTGWRTGASGFVFSKEFWEYETSAGAWSRKADFPGTARLAAVGFAIEDRGYIGTGEDSLGDCSDFWEYNPISNEWTEIANFPGSPRSYAVGFSVGNSGYVGAGIGSAILNDFWEWNQDDNAWAQIADYPGGGGSGIREGDGFCLDSVAYMGLGIAPGINRQEDFWRFSPDSVSGFAEGEQTETISVWPNPAGNQVWVKHDGVHESSLCVFGADGRMVRTQSIDRTSTVDIEHCAPGLYVFEVATEKEVQRILVVKVPD